MPILAVGIFLYKSFCAAFLEKRVSPFRKRVFSSKSAYSLSHFTQSFSKSIGGSKDANPVPISLKHKA